MSSKIIKNNNQLHKQFSHFIKNNNVEKLVFSMYYKGWNFPVGFDSIDLYKTLRLTAYKMMREIGIEKSIELCTDNMELILAYMELNCDLYNTSQDKKPKMFQYNEAELILIFQDLIKHFDREQYSDDSNLKYISYLWTQSMEVLLTTGTIKNDEFNGWNIHTETGSNIIVFT